MFSTIIRVRWALAAVLLVASSWVVAAPVELKFQGFEGVEGDTWGYTTAGPDAKVSTTARGQTGSYSMRLGDKKSVVEFDAVDVSGYTDLELRVGNSALGVENGDALRAYLSVDGGDFEIIGYWKFNHAPYNADYDFGDPLPGNASHGGIQTNPWATSVSASSTIALRFKTSGNKSNEFWFVDDVSLRGVLAPLWDTDSEIDPPSAQIPGDVLDSDLAGEELVFTVSLLDWGSGDTLPTTVSALTIRPGAGNDAPWSTTLGAARLYDDSLTQVGDEGVITDDGIMFSGLGFVVPDGDSADLTLAIELSAGDQILDGSALEFQLAIADVGAAPGGSSFYVADVAVVSDLWMVDVAASALVVTSQPEAVLLYTDFELSLAVVDGKGNVDTDFSGDVLLSVETGTDTALASATDPDLMREAVAGMITWTDLRYDVQETFVIGATDGAGLDALTTGIEASASVDMEGWTIEQSGSSTSLSIPAGVSLAPGEFLVVGRKQDQAGFEACFGGPLPEGVHYLNGHALIGGTGFPMVGVGRIWTLKDAVGAVVDATTTPAGNYSYERDGSGTDSFSQRDRDLGEPGAWAKGSALGGVLFTEYADNDLYTCEFVEILFDASDTTVCGDGLRQGLEGCDDGADGDGDDGCRDDCTTSCATNADCLDADADDCLIPQCLEGGAGKLCEAAPGTGVEPDGELCAEGSCDAVGTCVPSNIGKVIFSEFMPNPDSCDFGGDTTGEWFELHNPKDEAVNLQGWRLRKDGADLVLGDLSIDAGAYFVVCLRNPGEPGLPCDLKMGDPAFFLGNGGGSLELVDGHGELVDAAAYGGDDRPGESFALSPCHMNGADNDHTGTSWCYGTTDFTCDAGADKGTPGEANLPCDGDSCFSCNNSASDCPADQSGDCRAPACVPDGADYVCGFVHDGPDLEDDGELCTLDACADGAPTHLGQPGLACTTDPGAADGWCNEAGVCVADICGDGYTHDDEACDDGADGDQQDGCKDDCSFSCSVDVDCGDLNTTNCVFPTCVSGGAGRICEGNPGSGAVADGSACEQGSTPGTCNGGGLCVVPASEGDVLITEIMANPRSSGSACLDDGAGEWFEVKNMTLEAIDMAGWALEDDGSDAHVVSRSLVVPSGGVAVLCRGLSGEGEHPAFCDYWYDNVDPFLLGNNGDAIVLSAPGASGPVEVDRAEYAGAAVTPGVSLKLDPARESRAGNDVPWAWCSAGSGEDIACGDLGSPDAQNSSCGGLNIPPDPDGSSAGFMDDGGVAADGHSLAVVFANLVATDGTPALGRAVEVSVDGQARVFVPGDPDCTNHCQVVADANGDAIAYVKNDTTETANVLITDLGADPVGPFTGPLDFVAAISGDSATAGAVTLSVDQGSFSQATRYEPASLPQGALPLGTVFPAGLFATTIDVEVGATVTLSVDLAQPLLASNRLWKFGPESPGESPTWYEITTSDRVSGFIAGSEAYTIALTDGGFGDADGVANGVIVDPQGPGHDPSEIPTLGEWATALLLLGLILIALRRPELRPGRHAA